jgi:hypothetical protein
MFTSLIEKRLSVSKDSFQCQPSTDAFPKNAFSSFNQMYEEKNIQNSLISELVSFSPSIRITFRRYSIKLVSANETQSISFQETMRRISFLRKHLKQ